MTRTPSDRHLRHLGRLSASLGLAALALATTGLHAQTVYRMVGPDGRVTFSDQPPAQAARTSKTGPSGANSSAGDNLPYELRQVSNRYPVTLYTGDNCAPCGTGRALLASRGVPFTEKTVTSQDDLDALQRLAGEPSLPFLTIGGQQIKGFSDAEWTQFLDAAGYPKTSQLPASYRPAAASPLVAVQRPAAPPAGSAAPAAQTSRPAPSPPPAPNTNPAGIRF
jgi:glutaredoxin